MHGAVVIEADKKIGSLRFPNFSKQNPRKIRGPVNLLKGLFQRRTKRIRRHATERNVCGRTGEPFGACQLDRHHPQPFDVAWMPDGTQRDTVVNLKYLSSVTPEGQKQDSIGKTNADGRTPR